MTRELTTEDSSIMKMVQAIAMSPDDARAVVEKYKKQVKKAKPGLSEAEVGEIVCSKLISHYSKLAGTVGGATALAGVVPGVGTAVSLVGGTLADISACIKFQVDMCLCLALAVNGEITNEDAKNMSFIIALWGALEQSGSKGATALASKAGVKMLNKYLKGPALATIKELFKKIGIEFTKKGAAKAIPFGVGVVIGAGANYALTRYVGKNALDTLRIRDSEMETRT
ncbi:hypothetical protein [Variovorax sp. W2I14]|uniref:hypothetical protein n=1 Tax=Variovorax sp. W2I14 TaxID=3042290 RepID=UPI003D215A33